MKPDNHGAQPSPTSQIAARFSAAAPHYAQHARIQERSAQALWTWAQQQASTALKSPAALVDVGCGTGFLTQHLLAHPSAAAVHAIDIAPGMLQALRNQQPANQLPPLQAQQHPALQGLPNTPPTPLHTHCLDGSLLNANTLAWPQPTWLLSNLCMQWFSNLPQALHNWLGFAQGISVAVLLNGSFAPWKAAHQALGQPCMLRPLPSFQSILGCLHSLQQQGRIQGFQHQQVQFIDPHPNGLAFVRSLKAIGAHTPNSPQVNTPQATAQGQTTLGLPWPHQAPVHPTPLRGGSLHQVFAELHRQQGHGNMNYDIGFFHVEA